LADANEHDLEAKAKRVLLYGETSTGTKIPVKVTDDGSGLGKLSVAFD